MSVSLSLLPLACGSTITMARDHMLDESGHPVQMVHAEAAGRLVRQVAAVKAIHVRDVEQIVPICSHCRTVWPCATVVALEQA